MKYFVEIGDETREVELDETDLRVSGEAVEARLHSLPGTDRCHLRLDGRSVPLFARRRSDGWLIELEGRAVHVRVEDERTRRIRELASAAPLASAARELRAPMPGLIVRVEVEEGERVAAGSSLVVMEAMKMENELRAEAEGVVVAVHVEPGQTVERDEILLRLG